MTRAARDWITEMDFGVITHLAETSPFYLRVIAEMSFERGVPVCDVLSKTRGTQSTAHLRQDIMLRLYEHGYTSVDIGRFINRDHTTVLHGIQQARVRRVTSRQRFSAHKAPYSAISGGSAP